MTTQETPTLEGALRETLGKDVRFLRRQGITPANLYGRGSPSISFQVPTRALERLIHAGGRSSLVTVSIDGTSYRALLRELQRHPVTRAILHAEFYRVELDRPIQTLVPIHLIGEAPAARLPDALISQALHEVTVECLPADIPHAIEVDISRLTDFDSAIHIQDIEPLPGVTILAEPEQMIVRAGQSRVAAQVAAAEAEEEEAAEAVEAPAEEAAAPEEEAPTGTQEPGGGAEED